MTEEEWEDKWIGREDVNWLRVLIGREVNEIMPEINEARRKTAKASMKNAKRFVVKKHLRVLLIYAMEKLIDQSKYGRADKHNKAIRDIGDKTEQLMYISMGEKLMGARYELLKRSAGVERLKHEHIIEKTLKIELELEDWTERDKLDVGLWWTMLILEVGSVLELTGEPAKVTVRESAWEWVKAMREKRPTKVVKRPWLIEQPRSVWFPYVTMDANKKVVTWDRNKKAMRDVIEILNSQCWVVDDEMLRRWKLGRGGLLDLELPDKEVMRAEQYEGKEKIKVLENGWLTIRRRAERRGREIQENAMERYLEEAQKFDVYFGWFSDWRGRMYPMSTYNLQQQKSIRAMLNFKEGSAVSEESTRDVWITVAGYWGVGGTVEERVDWVRRNMATVEAVQAGSNIWMSAKDPWLFLRACLEVGRKIYSMPIPVDGSSNAYQHLAALTGNKGLAIATNCTKTERPRDLYGDLRTAVEKKLRTMELSYNWMDWLDRSAMKELCLAAVYKQSHRTVKTKLAEIMREKEGGVFYPDVIKVTDVIYKDIGKAYLTMDTGLLKEMEYPIITKDGFSVRQKKLKAEKGKGEQVQKRVKGVVINSGEDRVGWEKVKEVHLIHANDACHARLVLREFKHARMVHDEFAGRAGERSRLQQVVKGKFVEIYTGNQLAGDWDVKEVLESEFFFD